LLDLLFVSIKLCISGVKLIFQIFDLCVLPLFIVLELSFLIFEPVLDVNYFLLFGGQGPADLCDLVLELILKLDDPLLSSLKVQGLLPELTFETLHCLDGLIEALLSI